LLLIVGCFFLLSSPASAIPSPQQSIVIEWNNAALQGVPDAKLGAPMVSRALAIVHTCMYDAWAAYDESAIGTQLSGALRRPASERTAANKQKSISYAAFRALEDVLPVDADSVYIPLMKQLGYDPKDHSTDIETPADRQRGMWRGAGVPASRQSESAWGYVAGCGAEPARSRRYGTWAALCCAKIPFSFEVDRIGGREARRYQNLADAGDAVAMANLGIMYRRGGFWSGGGFVSKDDARAASWFSKAAEAGDLGGMINLAEMSERGVGGLQKDAKKAVGWYARAADLGSRVAQENLERLQAPN
jgi:hypothetical protein